MEVILKIIFVIPFITLAPGFFVSYAFVTNDEVSIGVRILISFVLTIITLPLLIYIGTVMGLNLSLINIIVAALIIIIFSVLFILIRKKLRYGN